MPHQLSLIVCSNLERECRALSGLPEFHDIDFMPLPVECDQVEARWQGLAEAVDSRRKDRRPVLLVGSFCLTQQAMDRPDLKEACQISQRSQCFEWIADKDVVERFLREEALILLPGWLKNWEEQISRRWPSDRKGAQAFFRESAKKIVLLDTGVYPKIERDLKEFARFLRQPYEVYFAGLGHLRMSLIQAVQSWRLDRERERLEDRVTFLHRQMSDYSRIGHLLGALTKVRGEEETRQDVLEIFRSLLSPRKAVYHPVEELSKAAAPAEDSPQDRILFLNADFAWAEGRTGLLLRVASGRETLGVIELAGLPSPERRDHDLSIALTLAKIAALAFINCRIHRALDEEREKSRAAQAARVSAEDKGRSFEGVPLGLYRTTPSGQILDANADLARILGYPDQDALRKVNAWDLHLNQSDRENWQSMLETKNLVENFETQLRRRDGTIIWVRDSVRAVKDRRGQILFYEGSLEDISRRKQLERASAWNLQIKISQADVSRRLLLPTTIEEMSALVLDHARRLTSSRTCFVGYVEARSGRLIPAAQTQDALDQAADHPEACGAAHEASGVWRSVIEDKKPILTNMPTLDPRYTGLPKWHFPVGQLLAVPALMEGHLVGLIVVANSDNLYSERDLEAVEDMAALYAIAVDRKRKEDELREMSLTDELTGLNNRRGFFTLADQQLKIANRSKKMVFLLYADLDGLKTINDTFGHDEGDRALAETGALLRDAFRESDIIARIGGDEFVVLTVDVGDAKPESLMSRVQQKFDARNADAGRKCPLSISQGIACYDPEAPCSAQDLVNLADKRMYDRKTASKAGRIEAQPCPRDRSSSEPADGGPGGDAAPDVIP